ncbi:ferrous ion transport protein A [Clostridium botulinum CFSAN002369]|nr:ferrous ion transport protein A [Clostridium botulinum CFSAN002369]
MSICELLPGQTAKISSISGNEKLVKRLMALGCIEGTEISLKKGPFRRPHTNKFKRI